MNDIVYKSDENIAVKMLASKFPEVMEIMIKH